MPRGFPSGDHPRDLSATGCGPQGRTEARGRQHGLAPVLRGAQILFSCVCFAFGQLLLPLFLAMLCSHLRVIIYV